MPWPGLVPGLFESSVVLYGGQTRRKSYPCRHWFESSVVLYGGQTLYMIPGMSLQFESSVVLYGGQTIVIYVHNLS